MSATFAARLNRLFDTVYPPGRGPHTSAEVIAALKAEGIAAVVKLPDHTVPLLAGLNADLYAAEMRGQLAA